MVRPALIADRRIHRPRPDLRCFPDGGPSWSAVVSRHGRCTGTIGPGSAEWAVLYGAEQSTHQEVVIHSRRRRINPRLIAPLAFLIASSAIALEIAYSVGHFFSDVAHQIP